MIRVVLGWSVAAALFVLGSAAPTRAASVHLLKRDGVTVVRNDPFLRTWTPPPAPAEAPPARIAGSRRRTNLASRSVPATLARLERAHAITASEYQRYLQSYKATLNVLTRLHGTRAAELTAVTDNLNRIAAAGMLTPSRLPALFLTLERNRTWWTTGSLLSYGQREQFGGSQIVWEEYPGQGLQLQELGSWGQVDGMYEAGPKDWPRLVRLVNELVPLGAERAGGIAWEYYFGFDGGIPPWTSAISQGTALQALAQAYEVTHDVSYLELAKRALVVFSHEPPEGLGIPTPLGYRYAMYSFAPSPGVQVINGFLQALIGLFDYSTVSGNPEGWKLFDAGDAEARALLPSYDTGAWSLYQPGEEDPLSYHELVTEFLEQLCSRTHAEVYCETASHFRMYLKTPPALRLVTTRLRAASTATVRFDVSKISRVGITVVRNGKVIFLTSASFSSGVHSFTVPQLLQSGTYNITLDATDLAGNYNQISGAAQVIG